MKKILILLVTALVSFSGRAYAQSSDLTDEQKKDIIERIEQKLSDFQGDLSVLVGKDCSLDTKQAVMKKALKLFIGGGESYVTQEPTYSGTRDVPHKAVTMGIITSKNPNGERINNPMKIYLRGLIKTSQNQNFTVRIEQADAVRVDSFRKVGEDRYIATAYILQNFARYTKEGRLTYIDTTAKKVTIYIERKEQVISGLGGEVVTVEYWEILLGNIEAEEIW